MNCGKIYLLKKRIPLNDCRFLFPSEYHQVCDLLFGAASNMNEFNKGHVFSKTLVKMKTFLRKTHKFCLKRHYSADSNPSL